MTTPTRSEIIERARELWHDARFRSGDPASDIEPEINELKENGFLSVATSDLMRDQASAQTNEWSKYSKIEENLPKKTDMEISNAIPFDTKEAMDTGFFCCGTSQSGKTNLAKHLVKMLIDSGIRVYVFDVSRAWIHDSPINHVVEIFGTEKHVTIPTDNAVLDIAGLTVRKKIKFVDTMCGFLYDMHVQGKITCKDFLVFEESQCYLPNGCMRLSTRHDSPCENVLNIVTVGANYNLRFGLISQFSSMVDKTPVKICQQRFLGWTWEKNDVDYLKAFIGKEWAIKLRDLQRGQFIAQCRNKIELIQTERYGQTHGWCNFVFDTVRA